MTYKALLSISRQLSIFAVAMIAYQIVFGYVIASMPMPSNPNVLVQLTLGGPAYFVCVLALVCGANLGLERSQYGSVALLFPISRTRQSLIAFLVDLGGLTIAYAFACALAIGLFVAFHGFAALHSASLSACVVIPLASIYSLYGLSALASASVGHGRIVGPLLVVLTFLALMLTAPDVPAHDVFQWLNLPNPVMYLYLASMQLLGPPPILELYKHVSITTSIGALVALAFVYLVAAALVFRRAGAAPGVLLVLASAASVAICTNAASAVITQREAAPYVRAQRLVDVGGHKLNIYCTGHGSPTVILDAGQANTTFAWRKVQPGIAKFTRVCSYDRAGMGFSQAGPLPRDADATVSDLHALLHDARIAPPYILVGHSIAGYYAPVFADRYLSEVAGMVLVDPAFPNQSQALYAVSPTLEHMNADAPRADTFCYEAAKHGKLAITHGSQATALCGFPPHIDAVLRKDCVTNGAAWCAFQTVTLAQYETPAFWSAYRSEDMAFYNVDSSEVLKAQRSYGALPLIVLTAADEAGGAKDSPFSAKEIRGINVAWKAGHDRLARLSSIGQNRIVRGTGHDIELDRPAVVVSAVAEIRHEAAHTK